MTKADWYSDEQYVPPVKRKLEEAEAVYALREAWLRVYGKYPEIDVLAILFAHSALETGRWKEIMNNNFGNIKKIHQSKYRKDDGHNFTMFATGENIYNRTAKKTKWHWFDPPHIQTHFTAFDSIIEGAIDYLDLLRNKSRYRKAWAALLKGDARLYSHELKAGGYYTASEAKYTKGVISITNEFKRREKELLSWIPEDEEDIPDTDPSPPLSSDVMPNSDELDTEDMVTIPDSPTIPPPPNLPENLEIDVEFEEDEDEEIVEKKANKSKLLFLVIFGGFIGYMITFIKDCF